MCEPSLLHRSYQTVGTVKGYDVSTLVLTSEGNGCCWDWSNVCSDTTCNEKFRVIQTATPPINITLKIL